MSKKIKLSIGVIGAGNMGAAIIAGIADEYDVKVCDADKQKLKSLTKKYAITVGNLEVVVQSDIVILAIKPQGFDGLLQEMASILNPDALIVSIAAGITSKYIEKRLGEKTRVIRTMPNLPVQVGLGVTSVAQGRNATKEDLSTVCDIFGFIGKSLVVEEKQVDAITAVSGSGPAYLFHFLEAYIKATKALGFSDEDSFDLAVQTVRGSLSLLEASGESPSELRERVTSKGGTTAAALKVFKDNKFEATFKQALKAAKNRAKELSV